jgi:hypothetical protein
MLSLFYLISYLFLLTALRLERFCLECCEQTFRIFGAFLVTEDKDLWDNLF